MHLFESILGPGHRSSLLPTRAKGQPGFGTYLHDAQGVRRGTGRFVISLRGDRISALVRFGSSVLNWFDMPRTL